MPKKKAKTKQAVPVLLVVLRLAFGWLFLYAGLIKLMNLEGWSAIGYITDAKTFGAFYDWFSSESNIGWVNFLNMWGQIAIGLGLVTGTLTRLAAWFGALMMLLYYFPGLDFPKVGHGMIVDDHVLYGLTLLLLAKERAGQYVGIDQFLYKKVKGWWI